MNIKIKISLLLVLLLPLDTWASFYHYNRYALQTSPEQGKSFANTKEPKSGLVISGALDSDKTSNYFGAFDLVFENKSDRWMVLRDIRISFLTPEQSQNVSIPVGAQYAAWAQGMQNLADYNAKKGALLGGLLAGAVIMGSSNNSDAKALGALTMGLSVAAAASKTNYNEIFVGLPPFHLLNGDIVIPPGMFMKRWLLLNSTNHEATGYISTIIFDFKDQDGNAQKYYLQFRDPESTSGWQSSDFTVDAEKESNRVKFKKE
jgi:hypothetical protein